MTETKVDAQKPRRTKEIKLRFFDDEYEKVVALAGENQIAVWIRDDLLTRGETGQAAKPKKKRARIPPPEVDPVLLRQLVGMGNNLNQIARKINSGEWFAADKVRILFALKSIEDELKKIRMEHSISDR